MSNEHSPKNEEYKQRFKAFCEGLEMQRIDDLIELPCEELKLVSAVMAGRIRSLRSRTHARCGGHLEEVTTVNGVTPVYNCEKCGQELSGNDYKSFQEYWDEETSRKHVEEWSDNYGNDNGTLLLVEELYKAGLWPSQVETVIQIIEKICVFCYNNYNPCECISYE